ncbi:TetR/AcrR family transcriptional regulator [Oceanirhabdus sp. W0125-5]|uniref:TetR/AcrR family transcriptional regulator n=1 Tax=Oceanirhabdus sp. W0125-5 TaxID=2999116 RepID=UPI0022F2C929|nr:TetR/AcrR family transcriptional regulator [Oceanirhabdus sp. W0125-5]WBW98875.1 TetR/AcrR family transcriptional regulator C-terminal domain-containing protein [Oceanirhabdus sp. W0125-5]
MTGKKKQNITKQNLTKKVLTNSLKKLMTQKPLEKISIREITEDCGLNRQTFYYHFSDIYNQLEWLYQQEAIALFAEHKGKKLWQEGLLKFFNYFNENREMCYCTLKSLGREHLFRHFYEDVYEIFRGTIDVLSEGIDMSDEYKEMLTQYYVFSFGGVIENWVYGNITQSPEELVEFIDIMLQDQMKGIALRYGVDFKKNTDN